MICYLIILLRPGLRHFLRRILDRIHVYPADNRALDRLKMLVSVSYMAPCNFQISYVRFSGQHHHWIQVHPCTSATLYRQCIYAVILLGVPVQQTDRLYNLLVTELNLCNMVRLLFPQL